MFSICLIPHFKILGTINILITGRVRNVHFIFFLNADTALSIAAEMVETLDLWKDDVSFIAELINSLISQLVPCWGTSSGTLSGGKRSLEDSATVHNEKFVASGVRECCSYGTHEKEASERGIYSEFTGLTNNDAPESVGASSQHAIHKKDFLLADYAVEKHRTSIGQYLMSESAKNSGTSYTGSWITASSDVSLSISSLSLTDKENELCDDLKLELNAIDLQYQQRCRELLKIREAAIENAKKKWMMKKISVL